MTISSHLCGSVIAFESGGRGRRRENNLNKNGRYQGSLVNFQKRQVANACEFIRLHSKRALIFVATTSHNWGKEIYKPHIATFVHNLKETYGCSRYVWVRELNSHGAPHYHFVCDIDRIDDPVKLSRYWSGLFGREANNSIRLGSKPNKEGRRLYYLENRRHCFYLAKYLGKSFAPSLDLGAVRLVGRKFGMSQEVSRQSVPQKFEARLHFQTFSDTVLSASGQQVTRPAVCVGRTFENSNGEIFNHHHYLWKQHPIHNVFFGTPREQSSFLSIGG